MLCCLAWPRFQWAWFSPARHGSARPHGPPHPRPNRTSVRVRGGVAWRCRSHGREKPPETDVADVKWCRGVVGVPLSLSLFSLFSPSVCRSLLPAYTASQISPQLGGHVVLGSLSFSIIASQRELSNPRTVSHLSGLSGSELLVFLMK